MSALAVAAALSSGGRVVRAQESAVDEARAASGPTFLYEASAALGTRRLVETDGAASVTTARYALVGGALWRRPARPSLGVAVEAALANHRYETGGTKIPVELGAVGLARFPVSPGIDIDVRAAGLKTIHDGDDRAPPSIILRGGAAARIQLAEGSRSFLAAGIEAEAFLRPETRGDGDPSGTAVGWGFFGVLRAEGPAALVVTALAAAVGLVVYQKFASEDVE